MKEAELRESATCAHCNRKIGETGMPLFYRIKIERHILNLDALRRQQGLAMMLGGNGAIAMAMGPDEDMTESLGGSVVTICYDCSTKSVCIALLDEMGDRQQFVGSSAKL